MNVQITTISDFRANLASFADSAVEDKLPVVVTRAGKPNVALVSEQYLRSLEETLYLMSDPRNAERLLESLDQAKAGKMARTFTTEEFAAFAQMMEEDGPIGEAA